MMIVTRQYVLCAHTSLVANVQVSASVSVGVAGMNIVITLPSLDVWRAALVVKV